MGKKKVEVQELDDVVEIEEEGTTVEVSEEQEKWDKKMKEDQESDTPDYNDVGWSDYVISLLDDSEKFEGRPRVTGLRRICERLLGRVISSTGVLNSNSYVYNPNTGVPIPLAVVTYTIVIQLADNTHLEVSGMAESNPVNLDDMFLAYPVACAESRAEGRALKKALHLTCLTADEIPQKNVAEAINTLFERAEDDSKKFATKVQIRVITNKCKSCDVDVFKFINSNSRHGPYDKITEVEKEVASLMVDKMNKYENDKSLIPDDIKKEEV